MCGILGQISNNNENRSSPEDLSVSLINENICFEEGLKELNNRGPEISDILLINNVKLGFTRLAINDLENSGMQPMNYEKKIYWICNGEIYNHKEIKKQYNLTDISNSDCSILGELWIKCNRNPFIFFNILDGVFSIILYDTITNNLLIGRDIYGVRPLFYTYEKNNICFGSEMKALIKLNNNEINIFSPSNFMYIDTNNYNILTYKSYITDISNYSFYTDKNNLINDTNYWSLEFILDMIKIYLEEAVRKRVENTERPIACLLSGGIDSSLIASLVQKELIKQNKKLETYSIGFEGSEDLKFAKIVANHIKSNHTEIIVKPDDFFNSIPEVIKHIETYDITTIRASVGNWFVCKEISKRSKAKVIFNGDGSDEVFGSYLYFYRSPSFEEYEKEVKKLLKNIHIFDVLRSDRSISSNGLEARTPFLDKKFVNLILNLPIKYRKPNKYQCEKWLLRQAFNNNNLLPQEILWRRKEAFSDGISNKTKSWFEEIQDRITPEKLTNIKYSYLSPIDNESKYYRDIFNKYYGKQCEKTIPYFWMPNWSYETKNPSARTLSLY